MYPDYVSIILTSKFKSALGIFSGEVSSGWYAINVVTRAVGKMIMTPADAAPVAWLALFYAMYECAIAPGSAQCNSLNSVNRLATSQWLEK